MALFSSPLLTLSSLFLLLLLLFLTTPFASAFNLTYPYRNATVIVYYPSSFTITWTSDPSTDPKEINIHIQANTRGGNPQVLCTNITTALNHCVVPADTIDFDNGPGWEAVVFDSQFPGILGQPATGKIIFVSKPFALYLYDGGSSTAAPAGVSTGTATTGVMTGTNTASVMTTALPSSSVSVGGAGAGAGDKGRGNSLGAVIAGIVAMIL